MRIFAIFLSLVLPVQAFALSCVPWHVEDAYQRADESPNRFFVVSGTLHFDQSALPVVDWDKQEQTPENTRIKASLKAHALSRSGFKTPFDHDVDLLVRCYGPWCSSATSGAPYLAFVEQTDQGFQLETNPCGGMMFQNPERDLIKRVRACFSGNECVAPNR